MAKLEDQPTTIPSSDAEEIESLSEEDFNQKTIFSSDDEDEPFDSSLIFVLSKKKKEEVRGSSEAPEMKSGTKRTSEENLTDVNSKRVKKEDEKKTGLDRRRSKLWSEEDEVAILQGMIDFKTDQWRKEGFYETIKEAISFNVGTNQFMEKIRSLKRKYLGQVEKNGFKQSFLRVHDHRCFELSKVIWGPDGIASVKSNSESKKIVVVSDIKCSGESKKIAVASDVKCSGESKKIAVESDVKCSGESEKIAFESADVKSNGEPKKVGFESDVKCNGGSKKKVLESDVKSSGESKKMVLDSDKSNGESKKSETNKEKKVDSVREELLFSPPNCKKNEDGVDVELPKFDWFEKSFLFRSIESIGVDEHLVKQRWSKVPVETKKRIEDELKLLQDKELECALQKANLLRDVTSAIAQAD